MSSELRNAAREIFANALKAVDVRDAVKRNIQLRDDALHMCGQTLPLVEIDRIIVIAMGKAAVPMFEAAIGVLGAAVPCDALVVAPHETHPEGAPRFILNGSHPTPGADSLHAADAILQLLASANSRTAVLFLISGGASAMVERPLDHTITIDELAGFHRALVGSGMSITQMNTMRKHISAVKGGRLAVAAGAAHMQCTLLVSDVPAASPDAVASGPSLPDSTTVDMCRELFRQLRDAGDLPESISRFFADENEIPETPKPDNEAFRHAAWDVILSGDHLARAAAQAALAAGFHTVIDNTPDDWDYSEAARYLLGRSASLAPQHPRTCLISVGEVGVSISSEHGKGGRNSQFALWCARDLKTRGAPSVVLSAGSDGVDGNSDAAGAVCDETTVARAAALGYSTDAALLRFDTAPLLQAAGDSIHTGPTGNNLRDLRLILTER